MDDEAQKWAAGGTQHPAPFLNKPNSLFTSLSWLVPFHSACLQSQDFASGMVAVSCLAGPNFPKSAGDKSPEQPLLALCYPNSHSPYVGKEQISQDGSGQAFTPHGLSPHIL